MSALQRLFRAQPVRRQDLTAAPACRRSRRWVGEPQTRQLLGAGRDPRGSRAAPLRSSNDDSAGVGARSKADRNMEEEGAAAEEEEPAGWENEPSFDELELSPELYEELGVDEEQLEDDLAFAATDMDPLGKDVLWTEVDPEDVEMQDALRKDAFDAPGVGPRCVLAAGLRLGEAAVVRASLDRMGMQDVKVIPVHGDMLYMPASEALGVPEPDWEQPAPDVKKSGGWGAQRTVLLSGLSGNEQMRVVDLLESAGLPGVCVAVFEDGDARRQLGSLLGEAVQEQRGFLDDNRGPVGEGDRIQRGLPNIRDVLTDEVVRKRMAEPDIQEFLGNSAPARGASGAGEGSAKATTPPVPIRVDVRSRDGVISSSSAVMGTSGARERESVGLGGGKGFQEASRAGLDKSSASSAAETEALGRQRTGDGAGARSEVASRDRVSKARADDREYGPELPPSFFIQPLGVTLKDGTVRKPGEVAPRAASADAARGAEGPMGPALPPQQGQGDSGTGAPAAAAADGGAQGGARAGAAAPSGPGSQGPSRTPPADAAASDPVLQFSASEGAEAFWKRAMERKVPSEAEHEALGALDAVFEAGGVKPPEADSREGGEEKEWDYDRMTIAEDSPLLALMRLTDASPSAATEAPTVEPESPPTPAQLEAARLFGVDIAGYRESMRQLRNDAMGVPSGMDPRELFSQPGLLDRAAESEAVAGVDSLLDAVRPTEAEVTRKVASMLKMGADQATLAAATTRVLLRAGMDMDDLVAIVEQAYQDLLVRKAVPPRRSVRVKLEEYASTDVTDEDAPTAEETQGTGASQVATLTLSQLRDIAEKRDLSLEDLLEDARKKGVEIRD